MSSGAAILDDANASWYVRAHGIFSESHMCFVLVVGSPQLLLETVTALLHDGQAMCRFQPRKATSLPYWPDILCLAVFSFHWSLRCRRISSPLTNSY